jgi:hypothetical protein
MLVIARHYATQSLEFRTNIRGVGLGDWSPLLKAGGKAAGKRDRYQERSHRDNEFVIYMRGGTSFIYFGPSFKASGDPFWIRHVQ